jgi:hypothetical protein
VGELPLPTGGGVVVERGAWPLLVCAPSERVCANARDTWCGRPAGVSADTRPALAMCRAQEQALLPVTPWRPQGPLPVRYQSPRRIAIGPDRGRAVCRRVSGYPMRKRVPPSRPVANWRGRSTEATNRIAPSTASVGSAGWFRVARNLRRNETSTRSAGPEAVSAPGLHFHDWGAYRAGSEANAATHSSEQK